MSIKRSREESREIEALAMANCLMLLSQIGKTTMTDGRVFECKTCNKTFPSFQALGGHRASHKRPKIMANDSDDDDVNIHKLLVKPKTHECTICGAEFALGQALGGHMRCHRGAKTNSDNSKETSSNTNSMEVAPAVPILKRCNSSKRVFSLDLNLKLGW